MVYIIHFSEPIGNDNHQAQHYVGYCEDGRFNERMEDHKQGRGARILAYCSEVGIKFDAVNTFPGEDRSFERKIKNQKNTWRYCPYCRKKRQR